jgi:hypothetical protein
MVWNLDSIYWASYDHYYENVNASTKEFGETYSNFFCNMYAYGYVSFLLLESFSSSSELSCAATVINLYNPYQNQCP